jgi:hypothetical protein
MLSEKKLKLTLPRVEYGKLVTAVKRAWKGKRQTQLCHVAPEDPSRSEASHAAQRSF